MAMALVASPSASAAADREEIAFFDVETSMPMPPKRRALLEFGAILVCPRRLVEVFSYSRLVRPADLDVVPAMTSRCNGITRDALADAPPFRDVADDVYDILNGRVWAGHNIVEFDSEIIREAFADIGRPPPQPKGMIDTYRLLAQRFGPRAGDMKMQTLANYFGLGRQRHRSLDDVKMNIDVVKYCATVIFLEQEGSPQGVLTVENLLEGAITSSQPNGAPSLEVPNSQVEEMKLETTVHTYASPSGHSAFVETDNISKECIKISVPLLHRFGPRTVIQHKNALLQLSCEGLKVHFGVNAKFLSKAGLPKVNFLVDIPENLREVLQFCDDLARSYSPEAGSNSEWRPLIKSYGNANCPTVRLNIPTVFSGDTAIYSTHIYQKDCNGVLTELVSRKVDAAGLDSLLRGNKVDACFSLEVYEFQQSAGIRLVAKRLDVHYKWYQQAYNSYV